MNKYILLCVALLVSNIHADDDDDESDLTCQYVAIDSSECESLDLGCGDDMYPDEYINSFNGEHYDYDCTNIAECPMNPNDGFDGIYCEADAYAYMKDQEAELENGVEEDKNFRPPGTNSEENNCNLMDVYTVECTSTLGKVCSYVPKDGCLDEWGCDSLSDEQIYEYTEHDALIDYDCENIVACPMTPTAANEGMICEADAVWALEDGYKQVAPGTKDMTRPEGTSADLNNCVYYDVYEVECTSTLADTETTEPETTEPAETFEYAGLGELAGLGQSCDSFCATTGRTCNLEGTKVDSEDEFKAVYDSDECEFINPGDGFLTGASFEDDGECLWNSETSTCSSSWYNVHRWCVCDGEEIVDPVAGCCTTWTAECYTTASQPTNNFHACKDCGYAIEHCDNVCSSGSEKSGDLADSIACQECCQGYDHEVPWNCPAVDTETTEPETTEPATTAVETTEAPIDVCADYEKKACRKVYSDECMWSSPLKSCVSNDWKPVCSDFTSDKTKCKRFAKEGYACEWSAKKCQATDAPCVPGWIEVELLKQKDNKTKLKYVSSIEDCIAFATDNAKGVIYEPNSSQQKCFIFATVGDYHPGTSGSADEVIWFNETC